MDSNYKLYLVTLQGENFLPHYVVSTNPTAAYETVRGYYDHDDIGHRWERELKTITFLADMQESDQLLFFDDDVHIR